MGLILQTERRAVEAVFERDLINLEPNQSYFLEGKELFFTGVSLGLGTCSDLHGIDIAIFEETNSQPATVLPIICQGAVFIRRRKEDEPTDWIYPEQIKICRIAEGIKTARIDGSKVYFESTRTTKIYIPLI